MPEEPYTQRIQLHGGQNVHGAAKSGDVIDYPITACHVTVISVDTQLDPQTPVTCQPCGRTMQSD